MDFKSGPILLFAALLGVIFLILQCVYFLIHSYRNGKKLGIETSKLKSTVITGVLFSVIPSLAIVATAIMFAQSLGIPFSITRMIYTASIQDNIMVLESVFSALNLSLSGEVTGEKAYVTIVWAGVLSGFMALLVFPFALKFMERQKIKKREKTHKKNFSLPSNMGDAIYSGIVAVFVAIAIAGQGEKDVVADGAGVLSVGVLITSFACMALLKYLGKRFSLSWINHYAVSISMLFSIALASVMIYLLPESFILYEWRG